MLCMLPTLPFSFEQRNASALFDTCQLLSVVPLNFVYLLIRASDISWKKKQNFAGFSGANSRKNRLISRDFRGKKVKICGTIGRFQAIFAGENSKFAGKSAHFEGF